MKKSDFRSKVMNYAHQLFNATHQAWRICMLKAWELYRLAKRMRQGIVTFFFVKLDGSIRKANGTLMDLPAGITQHMSNKAKSSAKTFAYFDVDKQSFRCFRIENLLKVC